MTTLNDSRLGSLTASGAQLFRGIKGFSRMPDKPPTFRPYGAADRAAQAERARDNMRREQHPYRNWYKLAIWDKRLRPMQLSRHPLCEPCEAQGLVVVATVVNHRIAHRGDWARFIDPANHQSTCKPCHDGAIQRQERAGG